MRKIVFFLSTLIFLILQNLFLFAANISNTAIAFTENSIETEDDISVQIKYPKFKDINQTKIDILNTLIKKLMDEEIRDVKQYTYPPPSENVPKPYSCIDMTYEVNYNKYGLISVSLSGYISINRGRGGNEYRCINFDAITGNELKLSDIFIKGSDYLGRISSLCKKDLKEQGHLKSEAGADPKEENYTGWNLTNSGLKIVFAEYQVGNHSDGDPEVLILYDKLEDIIDPAILKRIK